MPPGIGYPDTSKMTPEEVAKMLSSFSGPMPVGFQGTPMQGEQTFAGQFMANSPEGIARSTVSGAKSLADMLELNPMRQTTGEKISEGIDSAKAKLPGFLDEMRQNPNLGERIAGGLGGAAEKMEPTLRSEGLGAVADGSDLIPGAWMGKIGKILAGVGSAVGSAAMVPGDISRARKLAQQLEGRADPSVIEALNRADAPVPMEMRPKSEPERNSLVSKASRENEAVARREAMRESGVGTVIEDQIDIPGREINPEEMVGSVGVPFVSDRSRADGRLTHIAGAPLTMDVYLQGGIDFPKLNGAAWASMFDTAAGKQNNVRKASEATGKRVLGVTTLMGHEAINFSTPIIEGMIGQLDAIDLPASAIKKFDDHVNTILRAKGRPEFLGLQHPEALDQLIGRGVFEKLGAGELRKTLIKEMAKVDFRKIGFPIHRDVVNAITRPDLKRANIGEGGLTIMETQPDAKVELSPIHNSYNGIIPGRYFGGLAEALPPDILFPKTFEKLAKSWTNPDWKKDGKGKRRGLLEGPKRAPLTDSMRTGSLVSAHLWEDFDQEWLDGVMQYMEKIKSARGNEALAVLVLGAGMFEGLEGNE